MFLIDFSEPAMQSHVRALVDDKKEIHHIVHPSAIDKLRQFKKDDAFKMEEIVSVIHRYDNNWIAPWLVTKDLPWNNYAVLLDPSIQVHLYAYFKYLMPGTEFTQYLEWVSRKKVILDSYHRIHNYGRSAVDAACIGVIPKSIACGTICVIMVNKQKA